MSQSSNMKDTSSYILVGQLRSELEDLRCGESSAEMNAYCLNCIRISGYNRSIGSPFTKDQLLLYFLKGLPPDYSSLYELFKKAFDDEKSLLLQRFTDDLVMNIFSKLPIPAILRLRCLSKTWYRDLLDPRFVLKNNNELKNRLSFIAIKGGNLDGDRSFPCVELDCSEAVLKTPFSYECPLEYSRKFLCFTGICNGLICTRVQANCLSIWNPSMRESIILPTTPNLQPEYPRPLLRHIETFGFGLDLENKCCKVLSIVKSSGTRDGSSVYIHTLGSSDWRVLDKANWYFTGHKLSHQVFLHGCLHWIGVECAIGGEVVLACFSISNENFKKLPLPLPLCGHRGLVSKKTSLVLAGVKGKLWILEPIGDLYAVWVMNEYGEVNSWSVVFKVPRIGYLRPLHSSVGGDIIIFLSESLENGKLQLVKYIWKSMEFITIALEDDVRDVRAYAGSLVSVHSLGY